MERFYYCTTCKRLVYALDEKQSNLVCCGKPMLELKANSVDAANEKHVPVINVEGLVATVTVGEVIHPMIPEHYIEWIAIETNKGVHRVTLKPGEDPVATFVLADGEVFVSAYEHCNLHGLWKR